MRESKNLSCKRKGGRYGRDRITMEGVPVGILGVSYWDFSPVTIYDPSNHLQHIEVRAISLQFILN